MIEASLRRRVEDVERPKQAQPVRLIFWDGKGTWLVATAGGGGEGCRLAPDEKVVPNREEEQARQRDNRNWRELKLCLALHLDGGRRSCKFSLHLASEHHPERRHVRRAAAVLD